LAKEAREREVSAAAAAGAASVAVTEVPAEFLELNRKIQELEKQLNDKESRRGPEAAELFAAASAKQAEFLEQQVRVNAAAVNEVVKMGLEGNAATAERNSAAFGNIQTAFQQHLAAEGEKQRLHDLQIAETQRLHDLQIAEFHRKIAEDARIAAEKNSEVFLAALGGFNRAIVESNRLQQAVSILMSYI
jgi:hypothetical protein